MLLEKRLGEDVFGIGGVVDFGPTGIWAWSWAGLCIVVS